MTRVAQGDELLAGQLGDAVDVERRRRVALGVGLASAARPAPEDVVAGEEDDAGPDGGGGASHVAGPEGVDGEGQGRVDLAVVDPVEGGGVDHPIRCQRLEPGGQADAVDDVDVLVAQADGRLAEGTHQVMSELTGGPEDDDRHAETPWAPLRIVSRSQRMLK